MASKKEKEAEKRDLPVDEPVLEDASKVNEPLPKGDVELPSGAIRTYH